MSNLLSKGGASTKHAPTSCRQRVSWHIFYLVFGCIPCGNLVAGVAAPVFVAGSGCHDLFLWAFPCASLRLVSHPLPPGSHLDFNERACLPIAGYSRAGRYVMARTLLWLALLALSNRWFYSRGPSSLVYIRANGLHAPSRWPYCPDEWVGSGI
jgi:hypothetical protein